MWDSATGSTDEPHVIIMSRGVSMPYATPAICEYNPNHYPSHLRGRKLNTTPMHFTAVSMGDALMNLELPYALLERSKGKTWTKLAFERLVLCKVLTDGCYKGASKYCVKNPLVLKAIARTMAEPRPCAVDTHNQRCAGPRMI
jgi:hypothetical protein